MAKIDRFNGNVQAFGSQAQGTERTVFGDTTQSDTLDANITADFLRGWGIVGVNENPTKQDFNGLAFTLGQLISYLHQMGVPEWNAGQEYFAGSVVTTGAGIYQLKSGGDGSVDPDSDNGANWSQAPTADDVSQRVKWVTSLANLKAETPQADYQYSLDDSGRSGVFVFRSGDQSANVAADPQEGEWVAPDDGAIPAGSNGAFQRLDNQILNDQMFGNTGASSMIAPDAISDDGIFYQRAAAQDGLLTSSKTLVDNAEHIFDASSRAYKVLDNEGINITLHGEQDFPRLVGQIAQNVETFVTDGNRIYAIGKGSYTNSDSSLLAVYQVTDTTLSDPSITVDLGVGADTRAMDIGNGYLYIFSGPNILVYETEDYAAPTLVATVSRPNTGFVQTCSIINGLLVAPVWGSSNIETYSLDRNGFPSLYENFTVTAGASNASIVDAEDGSYILIRHVNETNVIGRFWFDSNKKIVNMSYFTLTGMSFPRYGVVRNSKMYSGSFASGDVVEVTLAPATPVVNRTFDNLSTFILYDNYLIGGQGDTANKAINLDTGIKYDLNSGLQWLYPQVYGDSFIAFIQGDEAPVGGEAPNDSPLGQKIAVYKLKGSAKLNYPISKTVESYAENVTPERKESSYRLNGLVSGFNQVGVVRQTGTFTYGWLEIKATGFVVVDQANSASTYKMFEGRALLLYSGGAWSIKEAYSDDVTRGASGVTFALSVGSGVSFGINAGSVAANAITRLKIEIASQNIEGVSL